MYKRNHFQAGLVLPMVLIFLVIMMFLGTAAIRNVTLEEKMSGNLRGRNLAFQAAEQALRFCEKTVLQNTATAVGLPINAEGPITTAGADKGKNYWEVQTMWDPANKVSMEIPKSVGEAAKGAPALAGRPQCIVESSDGYIFNSVGSHQQQIESGDAKRQFRITSRGFGLDLNTMVQLQSYLIF